MINRTEDNFKEALKTLVTEEPEKLAFFDGADKGAIPPFIYDQTEDDTRTKVVNIGAGRRRRNMFGMIAAAACSLVFVFAAVISYGPDTIGQTPINGGAASDSAIVMPAPEDDDEEHTKGAVKIDAPDGPAEGAFNAFPLFVAIAVVFAALFLILFVYRRKLKRLQ